ncbi:hypothetical protein PVAP13_7KG092500 [Panicum virgatum]|uniref:Uncharacterized protein n=1 Tax=Panicum virgatum TaxID=38727 RepID=A0A8T0QAL8_PANVG|nr:hypothetical protein PVAP13_7KG092500 [Panicum virgatum]
MGRWMYVGGYALIPCEATYWEALNPFWGRTFLLVSLVTLVLVIVGGVYFKRHCWQKIFGPFDPVEYTITIAAVSGLDPATDLQARPPLLNPAFNLTLRIASPTTACYSQCIDAGTTVEVSYLRSGVPLATGPAPAFCVDVGEQREEGSIVAWGEGVRLPGFVLDSLAADMRNGTTEFGIKLAEPLPYCGSRMSYWSSIVRVLSCRA